MSEMIRFAPVRGFAARMALVGALLVSAACSGTDSIDPLARGASLDHKPGHATPLPPSSPTPPSQATSLAIPQLTVSVEGSTVTVSWPAVTGAIEYQLVSGASGIQTPTTTATTIVANNVPNGTYTVKARARTTSLNNESSFSDDLSFTVAVEVVVVPPVVPPVTPPADNTAPVISYVINGTPSLSAPDWYTSNVTVTWTVSDAQSAVTSSTGCEVATVSSNTAGVAFTCTATSAGGTASITSSSIKRDNTPPVITGAIVGTLGSNGWYTSSATLSWTVSDDVSPVTSPSCGPVSVNNDQFATTYACSATSAGGSSSNTASIKRDATVPAVSFSGNAAAYTVDQTVSITCSATDATSGLASSVCPNVSGAAYLFNIGSNVFVASATDNAGNTNGATTIFTVSVTYGSLCNLTKRFVSHTGIANSLCVKLNAAEAAALRGNLAAKAGPLNAYVKEVQAQTGKSITAANAAILIRLAGLL